MFELPPASVDPGFHAAGAADLLGHLARYRRNENTSVCAQVLAAAGIWWERLREETAIVQAGGEVTVGNSVYAEIGTVLGCSATVAHTMVEVGTALQSRFPMLLDSFDTGVLDFARVRTVTSVLREASAETLAAIEIEVHAAAVHLTPGPLRAEVWRLWSTAAPEEARAVRERAARERRTAYVRRGSDGLSWLTAAITDLEGVEADRLLDDIAATVCAADPRSRGVLRADGLMALLHGESFLPCRCGAGDCPNATPPAPRRGCLTQIVVDVATLLGLADTPARLGDGTPVDADLARRLAADSTWQAILTELRSTLDTPDAEESDPEVEAVVMQQDSGTSAPPADAAPVSVSPVTWLQPTRRGRVHPAGVIGYGTPLPTQPGPGAGTVIDAWLTALERDPALAIGTDPTGHGGRQAPPAGALRYRPSAETAALVRAAYPTCVFPGCCVPASRCELDHRVAFDHADPARGGWTIPENLQPLCKRDHDIKTRGLWSCVLLAGGVILWTSPSHAHHVTLPAATVIPAPALPEFVAAESEEWIPGAFTGPFYRDDELLYEPTWWEEMFVFHDQPPLTPRQLDDDPYLKHRYRQHEAITQRRRQLQPAPF